MKHLFFTTLLLLQTIGAFAQITLNASDLPTIGMQIEQEQDTMPAPNIQPGGTGAGTWDFSDLEDHGTTKIVFLSPQGLPFANKFPEATMAVKGGDNIYEYIKVTSQSLQILGSAGSFQVDDTTFFDVVIPFTPPQTILKFPATYNQMFVEDVRQVLQIPFSGFFDSLRIITNKHRTIKIDAYGTVKTPAGEFNSLRAKEHVVSTDSTLAYVGGFWILLDVSPPNTDVSFAWWGKINGYAFALAELSMDPSDPDHHVNDARWVKSIGTGTTAQQTATDWRLYPNPATEFVWLEWPENMTAGRLEVYDLAGKLVLEKNIADQPERLNLGTLPRGIYVVVLKNRANNIVGAKTLEVR